MPGDDLLFQRLSDSTIGAVWFHGRVRDGIGWVTDAMVTKLCSQRIGIHQNTTAMFAWKSSSRNRAFLGNGIWRHLAEVKP